MGKNDKGRKLVSLCALGMMLFLMSSLVPADAAFSSVTITDVKPTELHPGDTKEVEIEMHVKEEAPNGVYSVPVACSWRGYYFDPTKGYVATNKAETQLGISFNVIGKGVINIGDVTTDPTDIRPGNEDIEIKASIENSGEAAVKDVEAKLLCDDKFKPSWSGTDRSYIGRLNSGEKGEAIFHVDVADGIESNTYSIPLQIKYKDTKGGE